MDNRKTFSIPKNGKPGKISEAIYILTTLNSKGGFGFSSNIEELSNLTKIRNCVVHGAGLIEHYRFASDLPGIINLLRGIRISQVNLLGPSIEILEGAIEAYAETAREWLPRLDELCTKHGLLQAVR